MTVVVEGLSELLGYWAVDVCYQTLYVLVILSVYTWLSSVVLTSSRRRKGRRRDGSSGVDDTSTGDEPAGDEGGGEVQVGRGSPPLPPYALSCILDYLTVRERLHLSGASRALVAAVQLQNDTLRCRWPGEHNYAREPLVRLLARHEGLQTVVLRDLLAVVAFGEAVVAGCCAAVVDLEVNEHRWPGSVMSAVDDETRARRLRRYCQKCCATTSAANEQGQKARAHEQRGDESSGKGEELPRILTAVPVPLVDSTWCLILSSRLAVNLLPRVTRLRLLSAMGTPGLVALACALEVRSLELCRPLEQLRIRGWVGTGGGHQLMDSAPALRAMLRSASCIELRDLEVGEGLGQADMEAVAEYLKGKGGKSLQRLSLASAMAPPPLADSLLQALAGCTRLEELQLVGFRYSAKPLARLRCRLPTLRHLSLTQAWGLSECLPAIVDLLDGGGKLASLRLESAQEEDEDEEDEAGSSGSSLSAGAALLRAIEGGAFGRLQHLRVGNLLDSTRTIEGLVETLAKGPPCAGSLRSIEINGCPGEEAEGVRGLAAIMLQQEGLLRRSCPSLEHVCFRAMKAREGARLAASEVMAVLCLDRDHSAATSAPKSRGESGRDSLELLKCKLLTPGGCPLLGSVDVMVGGRVDEKSIGAFVREVSAARPSVKVKVMTIRGVPSETSSSSDSPSLPQEA